MADFTLLALKNEIVNDPLLIGYKNVHPSSDPADWKGDQVIADLINAKNYTIDRVDVEMENIRAACTYQGYNTLSIDEQEWIRWMTPNSGDFRVTVDMKLQLSGRAPAADGVGGAGTNDDSFWAAAHRDAMAPAMLALIEVPGSRAEVLWGEGKKVSAGEVGRAANV